MNIGSLRITPAGLVLLVILIAGLLVAGLAPASVQVPAFVVAAVSAGILAGGGLSGGRIGLVNKSLEDRRREFGARPRREQDVASQADEPDQ